MDVRVRWRGRMRMLAGRRTEGAAAVSALEGVDGRLTGGRVAGPRGLHAAQRAQRSVGLARRRQSGRGRRDARFRQTWRL